MSGKLQLLSLSVALALSLPSLAVAHGHEHEANEHAAAPRSVQLVGEVMDLACYMQHPADGQGPGHAACARQCINKGLGTGFKVGDTLYVLLGPGHANITETVAPFAGQRALITGKVIERDGLKSLIVDKIEPSKGG